jgi:tetratricopeptide (TPR) repeat protein
MRRRIGVALVLAGLAAAGFAFYRRGGGEQAAQGKSQAAAEVTALLAAGDLDRLAPSLKTLAPADKPLQAEDPHLDLIVSAEAALYRYQDAAPERLARIEPFLARDSGKPARLLAWLTVASRPERMASYDSLIRLAPQAQGPEVHALLATMAEERGDAQAAHTHWEQAFKAGPQWLPHRYMQCAFEARARNTAAVQQLTEHMLRVAPSSAWTRLAQQHFGGSTTSAPATPIPVAQYFAELTPVLRGLAARDLTAARQALGRAFDAVNGQPAFVLDAFKALREAKADSLAMELTSYETWPRGNAWAKSAMADLQIALANPKQAPTAAEPAADTGQGKVKTDRKKNAGKGGSKKVKGKSKGSPRRK